MKQSISISRFKFASLLFAFAFVVLFTSCDNDDDASSTDINRVSMKTQPQVKYVLGNALNLSNMVITLDKGGNSVDIPFSSFVKEGITTEPENGKVLELSDKSVTIKIGASGKGLIQAINVTNNVTAMEIKVEPLKKYVISQKLDLTDMVLTLTYENGDRKDFTYSEIKKEIVTIPANGDVLPSTNTKEVLITYISSGVNIVQDITVFVFTPRSGVLVTGPLKSEYVVGEKLDLTGTVIRYTLYNGTVVDVAFKNFEAYKLSANPANNTVLAANVVEVSISHPLGAVVKIPITVNP